MTKIMLNEPLGYTEIKIGGFSDIYELLNEIIICVTKHRQSERDLFIPLDLFVQVKESSHHLIDNGVVSKNANKVLNNIKRISKQNRNIARIKSLSIDEFESEMRVVINQKDYE